MTGYEQISLAISFLALVVAIGSAILNYIITRRKFEASVYPRIKVGLRLEPYGNTNTGMTMICVHLTNLSDRLYVMNTRVSLNFNDPFRRYWHPFLKRWILYTSDRGPDVAPGMPGSVRLDKHGSLEEFLARSFGNRFIKEVPRDRTNPLRYQLVRDVPTELLVTVEYGVSVEGTGTRTFTTHYSVIPINGGEDKLVTNWDIREVPS